MRPFLYAVLVAGIVALAACAVGERRAGDGQPTALLPQDGFAPGWSRTAVPEVVGPEDLYQRIDGGAEVFLQEGFRELVVAAYTGGSGELEAALYIMDDAEAARRVWERQGRGDGIVEGLPGPASVDRYQLAALLDCAILVVDNLSGSEDAVGAMESLARTVAERIPGLCTVPDGQAAGR